MMDRLNCSSKSMTSLWPDNTTEFRVSKCKSNLLNKYMPFSFSLEMQARSIFFNTKNFRKKKNYIFQNRRIWQWRSIMIILQQARVPLMPKQCTPKASNWISVILSSMFTTTTSETQWFGVSSDTPRYFMNRSWIGLRRRMKFLNDRGVRTIKVVAG